MSPDQQTGLGSFLPAESLKPRTGLVTLLFTDIVSSTALKQHLGDKAGAALIQEQRALVRQLLATCPGAEEIETAGDSFLLSFLKPSDAVRFALVLQGRLRSLNQGQAIPLEERIGIHVGEVVIEQHQSGPKPKDLYGIQLDACARVMSLAKGGQVLMSRGVFDNARQVLKGEDIEGVGQLEWLNHGAYLLKGLEEPVEICEVREAGQEQAAGPPTSSEKAQRQVRPDEEPVLGWRPAVGQGVPNTRWMLEKKLGEGGFGEVWLGRNSTTKQASVFKFCFQAERVRFLKRELTLFRLLKERVGGHPNIAAIHDVYLDQPPFYVEMEYVEGQDLRNWCEDHGGIEAIPLETRLEIVAQAAEALQAAHDAGIIHRDVKPANILIGGKGTGATEVRVKLTDFGIGQVVSEEYLKGITRAGFTQTMVGSASSSHTGTQLYMAPELLSGKPASIRSDIYSLGVVLYQLIVGDFTQPVTTDWQQLVTDPLFREDLAHCFAGKPQDRFAGAGQLAKSLRAWEQRKVEHAERERLRRLAERRYKLLWAGGAATLLLAALAVALGYGMRKAQVERETQRRLAYAADMNLAQQALQESNLGRALDLLDRHRPTKTGQRDLRGWEWRYLWKGCRSDELTTIGQHDGYVQSVAVSPDGKWVASGGFDGLLKIWALAPGAEGGRCLTNLNLGGSPVASVAFSPDGRWLAAVSWANGFVLLRVPGWHREMRMTNTDGRLQSLAFSANSRLLAVGGDVWSLETRTRLRTLPCGTVGYGQPQVAWLPHSETLAGCTESNDLYQVSLFDVSSTNQDATVSLIPLRGDRLGRMRPAALAFSRDGNHLAVGCWDTTIRIHGAKDWREVTQLTNHNGWVSSLAFSPDGQLLASGSADHSIKIWRTRDWQETTTLRGHLEEVWTVAFTPDGQRLITGSKDHSVRLWPLAGRPTLTNEVVVLDPSKIDLRGVSGANPYAMGPSNILTVWDGETLKVRQRISSYPVTNVIAGVPSPDGRLLLMATAEGGLWLMGLAQGAESVPSCLQSNGPRFWQAEFSDHAKWLAVVEGDRLRLWNLEQQPSQPGAVHGTGAYWDILRFSRDERLFAAVTGAFVNDRMVVVWDLGSGERIAEYQLHRDEVGGLDFSPDGRLLATVGQDNTCKLFDLVRRQVIGTLHGQHFGLHSVRFSPDGSRLATGIGGGDGITLWDVETQREVFVPKQDRFVRNRTVAVRWLPGGGDSLLSVGSLGTLHLWHAPSWAEIEAVEKRTVGMSQ